MSCKILCYLFFVTYFKNITSKYRLFYMQHVFGKRGIIPRVHYCQQSSVMEEEDSWLCTFGKGIACCPCRYSFLCAFLILPGAK